MDAGGIGSLWRRCKYRPEYLFEEPSYRQALHSLAGILNVEVPERCRRSEGARALPSDRNSRILGVLGSPCSRVSTPLGGHWVKRRWRFEHEPRLNEIVHRERKAARHSKFGAHNVDGPQSTKTSLRPL